MAGGAVSCNENWDCGFCPVYFGGLQEEIITGPFWNYLNNTNPYCMHPSFCMAGYKDKLLEIVNKVKTVCEKGK